MRRRRTLNRTFSSSLKSLSMKNYCSRIIDGLRVLKEVRNPAEFFLFLRMLLFALSVPLLLRLKLSTLQTLLEPAKPSPEPEPWTVRRISTSVDRVMRFAQPLFRSTCLTRGTTLYYFLRRAGLNVSLCFGIGNIKGSFIGHCWLVRDGAPFLEAIDPRSYYKVMYSIPQSAPPSGNLN